MQRTVYVNGQFVPEDRAVVSIFDRGFLFADGVYEVTAVVNGRLVDYEPHIDRLYRSMGELQLGLPVSREELRDIHLELIRLNQLKEGGIYLEVTRGAADRDFVFPSDATQSTLVLFTQARNLVHNPDAEHGIAVITVPDIRWERRDIKSVALLAQVLAKQAARAAGAKEAWMHEAGVVTEGGSSNAYIITQDGRIVTRPLSNSILPGITRRSVIRLAAEKGLRIEERPFTLAEGFVAKEAFNTSATGLVMPVVSIDGKPVGDGRPGPVTRRLRELYLEEVVGDGAWPRNYRGD